MPCCTIAKPEGRTIELRCRNCVENSLPALQEAKIVEDVFGKDCLIFSLTGEYLPDTMSIDSHFDLGWRDEAGRGGLIN
jgi:hypothetical protein